MDNKEKKIKEDTPKMTKEEEKKYASSAVLAGLVVGLIFIFMIFLFILFSLYVWF